MDLGSSVGHVNKEKSLLLGNVSSSKEGRQQGETEGISCNGQGEKKNKRRKQRGWRTLSLSEQGVVVPVRVKAPQTSDGLRKKHMATAAKSAMYIRLGRMRRSRPGRQESRWCRPQRPWLLFCMKSHSRYWNILTGLCSLSVSVSLSASSPHTLPTHTRRRVTVTVSWSDTGKESQERIAGHKWEYPSIQCWPELGETAWGFW